MKLIQNLLILSVVFNLTACAPQPKRMDNIELEEKFVPNITENGRKFFIYTVSMTGTGAQGNSRGGAKPTGGRGSRSGAKPAGGRGSSGGAKHDRGSMKKKLKEKIEKKLLAKLADTGYCREGYFELDNSIYMSESFIRGECKEGATEEDRQIFLSET
jgi:hypothetical protein